MSEYNIRDLTEKEACDISDEADKNGKYRGKIFAEGMDSLCYELDGKFYEIWVTRDGSCRVVGGYEVANDELFPE